MTVGSHISDMLSGVSLSLAKKRVDKSTSCYSSCSYLSMTRTTNNLLTCQLVNSEQALTCETSISDLLLTKIAFVSAVNSLGFKVSNLKTSSLGFAARQSENFTSYVIYLLLLQAKVENSILHLHLSILKGNSLNE